MKLKLFAGFLALCVLIPSVINFFGWTILSRLSIGNSDLIVCSQNGVYIYAKSKISGKVSDYIPDDTAVVKLLNLDALEFFISEPITIRIKGRYGIINEDDDLGIYYPLLLNLFLPFALFWYAHKRDKKKKMEKEDESPSPSCD